VAGLLRREATQQSATSFIPENWFARVINVETLQDLIETTFGDCTSRSVLQPPNEAAVQRESAIAERLRTIENLKRMRLQTQAGQSRAVKRLGECGPAFDGAVRTI
jgi:hypothetical protein